MNTLESQRNGFRSPFLLTVAILAALLAISIWGSLVLQPGVPGAASGLDLGSATPASLPEGPPETLFSRVFEVVFLTVQEGRRTRTGSGLVVHEAGFIVTNAHVVAGADTVTVTLDSGRELDGEVWGADRGTDVAVLKVESPEPLVAAHLGDSDTLEVGEFVMAVGAPFNLRASGTRGIVSGLEKRGLGIATIERFIVTDAAINRGNSGGPLVNSRGEVVGINTAMISGDGTERGGFSGVGFAIPIDLVTDVASGLIGDGGLTRGYIGVAGMSRDNGILLATLDEDGPAAAAGLREGDLIVAVDGRTVESEVELQRLVTELSPRTHVEIEAIRDGERRRFEVVVGNWPADLEVPRPHAGRENAGVTSTDRRDAPVPGVVQVRGLDPAGKVIQVGSGIVLDDSGRVLTNAHVVRGADRVEVLVPGGEPRDVSPGPADERIDLALVTAEGSPALTPARLGDSEHLAPGDPVTAIGALDGAAVRRSRGRVLDLGYERAGFSKWVGLILTDARTERGYSGGPLLDAAGEVVGVLIAAQAADSQSLAIPIGTGRWAVSQLAGHGRVVRSNMGVAIMADSLRSGLVISVRPGGPGEAVGLQEGDRVIAADGSEIQDYAEWQRSVARKEPGTRLVLRIERDETIRDVELILEEETTQTGAADTGT